MSEREEPMKKPCAQRTATAEGEWEECGGKIVQAVTAMAIGDAVRLGIKKNSGEFNAVMEQVHRNNPGSKLNKKMSQNPDRNQATLSERLGKYEK